MRRGCWALLILLGSVSAAGAQTAPAAGKPVGASPTPAAATSSVKLGESSIELNGPWKFRTGDNIAWAQTDFDDSSWADMDLTPQTGWTATGYKHYAGYAWY